MTPAADLREFVALLHDTCAMLSQGRYVPNETSTRLFFDALSDLPMEAVRAGFALHVKTAKFAPTPGEIREHVGVLVDDGRPGPEEAWSIAVLARDPDETVVWTPETAQAWDVARKVFALGDEVGARMGREPGWRDKVPSGWATGTDRAHTELVGRYSEQRKLAADDSGTKNNGSFDAAMAVMPITRNPRSVRWLASDPFKGAHFATYPAELIRPFILAGCPEGGTVLDPFGGSGTTGLECDRLGRNAILIDLDARNVPMAEQRLAVDAGSVRRQRGLFAGSAD
jgi:DNA methylase